MSYVQSKVRLRDFNEGDASISVRKDMKLGICREHGGNPSSAAFCHSIGLNYVSCSPCRVPAARLAAAHAALGKPD
ncbi:hypothetical protein FACS1894216_19840 [Synergistales bacterium]|nr:hypothetical protein FACS1894216_19840 [Synergistales bacterium]